HALLPEAILAVCQDGRGLRLVGAATGGQEAALTAGPGQFRGAGVIGRRGFLLSLSAFGLRIHGRRSGRRSATTRVDAQHAADNLAHGLRDAAHGQSRAAGWRFAGASGMTQPSSDSTGAVSCAGSMSAARIWL